MMLKKDQFVDIAKVDEIPAGKMKHVQVNGKEIVIANMNGKAYRNLLE
jgi:nitrite reductase/ring-hydroxylating ferredoxin subunit